MGLDDQHPSCTAKGVSVGSHLNRTSHMQLHTSMSKVHCGHLKLCTFTVQIQWFYGVGVFADMERKIRLGLEQEKLSCLAHR